MGLLSDLGGGSVAIDSAAFIYFIEEHPAYLPVVEPLFEAVDSGSIAAVTSSLTLLETLVVPLRAGNHALAQRYEALLTGSRNLTLVPLDLAQLRSAAQLRAVTRLKTPDAIQLAAALSESCKTMVTNDSRYPPLPGLRILQVESYLGS
ncbi:MAG TPA: PIN domain-containing protein [Thermoanaerobaculia bacterium]|nr:PIN domain-containing protein [Thermoanaerobaculia bacterium]